MAQVQRVSELGFADFVAMLLVETLDAIVASHSSQEERLRALNDAAEQGLEDFTGNIADEIVEGALAELFPDGTGGTAVVPGGEVPSATHLATLGVVLPRAAVRDDRLTSAGVSQIRDAIRARLARTHWESLQEVARRGVPRVRVDGGVLRSKLTFSALSRTEAGEPEGPTDPAPSGTRTVTRVPGGSDAGVLRDPVRVLPGLLGTPRQALLLQRGVLDSIARTRLTVRPAAPAVGGSQEPSVGQETTATIYGEVEIRFHTEG
jgi:hypothetical protein